MPRARHIGVALRSVTVVLAVACASVPSAASAQEAWDVPNWTTTASGARILNLGHVDISSVIVDGALRIRIRDATAEGAANAPDGRATWHETADVVLQVRSAAATTIPDSRWGFIGAVGARVWHIDQHGTNGVLWPGWSAETIASSQVSGALDWTLTDVRGPGHVFLWQTDAWGNAARIFDSRNGLPDATRIPTGTHAHANWTFTAEGLHCLTFRQSGTLSSGRTVASISHLAIVVGVVDPRAVDPGACASGSTPADPGGAGAGSGSASTPTAAVRRITRSAIVPHGPSSPVDVARRAPVAAVACPAGRRSCTIATATRVIVTIAGRRHTLRVVAPRTVPGGRRGFVRVQLPPGAVAALHGRTIRIAIRIRVSDGSGTAMRLIRATLTGRPTVHPITRSAMDGGRRAQVAEVTCPLGGGTCALIVPARVTTTIAGRRYVLAVIAHRAVRPGRRTGVRVQFPPGAARALRGRIAPVVVSIRVADRTTGVARDVRSVLTPGP